MESSLRIKPNGSAWDLTGNTVVNGMEDTEMLFRIVTMTPEECSEFALSLTKEELHNIVIKIREHRAEAVKANVMSNHDKTVGDVTKFVVQKHITEQRWN